MPSTVAPSLPLRVKAKFSKLYCLLFGKVLLNDRFGLRYFLWKENKLEASVLRGCRTDDEGLILLIQKIMAKYHARRERFVGIDVGAYIGVVSLAMAQGLKQLDQIFAFEPSRTNFERLSANIELNHHQNRIFAHHNAVSDRSGEKAMLKLMANPGTNYLATEDGPEPHDVVTTVSLAEFCRQSNIKQIDLLKVDTEGNDLKVLKGAGELLEKSDIHYIFLECQQRGEEFQQTLQLLEGRGYEVFYIVRKNALLVRDLKNYPTGYKEPLNLLAISKKAPFNFKELGLEILDEQKAMV
jgi:FkbM family methyltransferase